MMMLSKVEPLQGSGFYAFLSPDVIRGYSGLIPPGFFVFYTGYVIASYKPQSG